MCNVSLLADQRFESFARKLVRRICLPIYVAHHAMTAPRPLTNLVHGEAESLTRWHAAAHDRCAVGANDDAVERPPRRRQVERGGADVGLQLG